MYNFGKLLSYKFNYFISSFHTFILRELHFAKLGACYTLNAALCGAYF